MRNILIFITIILIPTMLFGQYENPLEETESYFAIGVTLNDVINTVDKYETDRVRIEFAWILPFVQEKNIYIAPLTMVDAQEDTKTKASVGGSIFYADSHFGRFLESSTAISFQAGAKPDYSNFRIGGGFVTAWSFMGIHPGFRLVWEPTANDQEEIDETTGEVISSAQSQLSISIFGLF